MNFPFFRRKKLEPSELSYAALLIDMQERFLSRYLDSDLEPIISAQTAVLKFCASQDIPIVVVEYRGYGLTTASLQEVIAAVPRSLRLEKTITDALASTSLDEQLRLWNAADLLLMGIYASACVQGTSEGALEKNYRLHTARDLIASHSTLCGEKDGTNFE